MKAICKEQLAWNVCLTTTATTTKNYYMMKTPCVKTAATFIKTFRPSRIPSQQFFSSCSHSMFPRFTKEDLSPTCSRYFSSTPRDPSKRRGHYASTATNVLRSQIDASLSEDRLLLPTESHTYRLGRLLGRDCRAGDVILLFGDLGVGKTALARGYIHSAHADDSVAVTSPTYLLLNSYEKPDKHPGIPEILHMDLWRLNDAAQRPIVDFKRAFDQTACLIEWPDRLKSLTPLTRLEVHISYDKEEPSTAISDDDPWGFGTDDPYGSHEQRGRYVSMKPHGKEWNERIQSIMEEFCCIDATKVTAVEND